MPITQSRMLDLLSATRAILNHLASSRATIQAAASGMESEDGPIGQARAAAASGDLTAAIHHASAAYENMKSLVLDQIFSMREIQMQAVITITREETHFNIRKRGNDAKREHHRAARAQAQARAREELGLVQYPPYDPTNDGIPELPANYTREDYERERRERRERIGNQGANIATLRSE